MNKIFKPTLFAFSIISSNNLRSLERASCVSRLKFSKKVAILKNFSKSTLLFAPNVNKLCAYYAFSKISCMDMESIMVFGMSKFPLDVVV